MKHLTLFAVALIGLGLFYESAEAARGVSGRRAPAARAGARVGQRVSARAGARRVGARVNRRAGARVGLALGRGAFRSTGFGRAGFARGGLGSAYGLGYGTAGLSAAQYSQQALALARQGLLNLTDDYGQPVAPLPIGPARRLLGPQLEYDAQPEAPQAYHLVPVPIQPLPAATFEAPESYAPPRLLPRADYVPRSLARPYGAARFRTGVCR